MSPSVDLNDPTTLGMAPPGMPEMPPGMGMPGMPGPDLSVAGVGRAIAAASEEPIPEISKLESCTVDLPAGLITQSGALVETATVRELNGYDEERLSRVDMDKNVAAYVTELLFLGVEELNGEKPSKETLRGLLIGDRDALVLGIRRATYGNGVDFNLDCVACGNKSEVEVELDKDVPVVKLDDRYKRTFMVPLRHGEAEVTLINGDAQEALGASIDRKTPAEVNTLMLSKSVIKINGVPTMSQLDAIKALSAADRATLSDFMNDHQPGPQFKEILVPCATCGAEYPVSLGLSNLFRF